jgi:hypothetical protein
MTLADLEKGSAVFVDANVATADERLRVVDAIELFVPADLSGS